MDEWECVLNEREYLTGVFGLSDIAVYCSTYNLFRYVMVSTWRNLAAAVREGGQIDVRVDPTFVTVLVEYMNRFECRQIDLLPRM